MLIRFEVCQAVFSNLYGRGIKQVLHVGAHYGEEASVYCAAGVNKVVWAEANPAVIPSLSKNISLHPSARHLIVPFALWNNRAELDLNLASNGQSSSALDPMLHLIEHPDITFNGKTRVRALPFDEIFSLVRQELDGFEPDLINLDIQGAELKALEGIVNLLANSQSLKMIYSEVNYDFLYKDNALKTDIDSFLLPFGFHPIISVATENKWGDSLYAREAFYRLGY